jgi:hypothetical protein
MTVPTPTPPVWGSEQKRSSEEDSVKGFEVTSEEISLTLKK